MIGSTPMLKKLKDGNSLLDLKNGAFTRNQLTDMPTENHPPKRKQQLDEVRTLAVKLFEAGQVEKRKQPPEIWGGQRHLKFEHLPSESVAVWDAIAIEAFRHINVCPGPRRKSTD